jgi:hypothetical protein
MKGSAMTHRWPAIRRHLEFSLLPKVYQRIRRLVASKQQPARLEIRAGHEPAMAEFKRLAGFGLDQCGKPEHRTRYLSPG